MTPGAACVRGLMKTADTSFLFKCKQDKEARWALTESGGSNPPGPCSIEIHTAMEMMEKVVKMAPKTQTSYYGYGGANATAGERREEGDLTGCGCGIRT